MELETMFTEQKWNILKCLSEEKYSPLQLSEKLDTSMANISQQLKLLEVVNLVKKEKIRNRDKGKPRTLFSLRGDYAYLISTMRKFTNKRLLKVTDHHKAILRIWFLENKELHHSLESLYWKLEPYLENIDIIALNENTNQLFLATGKVKEVEKIAKSAEMDVKIFSR